MKNSPLPGSLNYSLESLPRAGLLGGYDRNATEQLFGRLNASYKELHADRARLDARVQELESAVSQRADAEQQIAKELELLRAQLEQSGQREQTLAEQLERAKADMDQEAERIRVQLEGELERAKSDADHEVERTRDELERAKSDMDQEVERIRVQLEGELERAKADADHEVERTQGELERAKSDADHEVERTQGELERAKADASHEVERIRARLEGELERAKAELAAHEKREQLVTELIESAKRTALQSRTEARIEAETTLKKTRQRAARMTKDAEREFHRLEAEKDRLDAMAEKLRADLSNTLMHTLEQLKQEGQSENAPRPKRRPGSRAAKANGNGPRAQGGDAGGKAAVKRAVSSKQHPSAPTNGTEKATADVVAESR